MTKVKVLFIETKWKYKSSCALLKIGLLFPRIAWKTLFVKQCYFPMFTRTMKLFAPIIDIPSNAMHCGTTLSDIISKWRQVTFKWFFCTNSHSSSIRVYLNKETESNKSSLPVHGGYIVIHTNHQAGKPRGSLFGLRYNQRRIQLF